MWDVNIRNALTPLIVSVPINFSATGDNVLVNANPGQIIRVFGFIIDVTSGAAATALTFKDGPNALNGPINMQNSNAPLVVLQPFRLGVAPLFSTTSGQNNLILNQSNNFTIGGILWYSQG